MNEDRLRQLYGRGIVARDARSKLAGACAVEPERLLALVRRELPEEEQLALLDRVMANSACREAFELLRVVEAAGRATGGAPASTGAPASDMAMGVREAPSAGDGPDHGAPSRPDVGPAPLTLMSGGPPAPVGPAAGAADRTPAPPIPWWRRGGAAVALAACALLAVGLVTRDRRAGEGEATRGAGDAVTLLSPATDPADGAGASAFVWHVAPGAARYQFELLGADGEPVHQATTSDTALVLPPSVVLQPGSEYRWLVRAISASGGQRSSSLRPLRLPAR